MTNIFINGFKLILSFICIIFLSSCPNYYNGEVIEHYPILPYTIYPTNDTINIGDTLWIEAHFSHTLEDWHSKEFVDYSGVELNSYFLIGELIDTTKSGSEQPDARHKFNRIVELGQMINQKIIYLDKNDSFFIKVGLIPIDTGFYGIGFGFIPQNDILYKAQVIEVGNDDNVHILYATPFTINNGNSTKYRATDKGFKFYYSPVKNPLQEWSYDNSGYYFTVVN